MKSIFQWVAMVGLIAFSVLACSEIGLLEGLINAQQKQEEQTSGSQRTESNDRSEDNDDEKDSSKPDQSDKEWPNKDEYLQDHAEPSTIIDPTTISWEDWLFYMGDYPRLDDESAITDENYEKMAEYCNRRSKAEGREPAYWFSSNGGIEFISGTNGYRLTIKWEDRMLKGKKNPFFDDVDPFWDEIIDFIIFPNSDGDDREHDRYIWGKNRHHKRFQDKHQDRSHDRRDHFKWDGLITGMKPLLNANINDTIPTFSWEPVEEAASYQIQISKISSSYGKFGQEITTTSEATYTPDTEMEAGETYRWRVRALNANGQEGIWSKAYVFTIIDAWDGTISNLIPANGSSTPDATPDFSWNPVQGADSYEMEIFYGNNDTAHSVINIDVNSHTPDSPLPAGNTYYWRVRAINSEDNNYGEWSDKHSLFIETIEYGGGYQPVESTETYKVK